MVYDEYFNNVSLLLPMNGNNNGTTFTDYSLVPKAITRFGDTKTVTVQSKYYGSSGYFDGNGDYLTVPDSAAFDFSVSPVFTVEMWVRLSANITNYAGIVGQDNGTASQSAFLLFFNVSNQILLQTRDTANTRYYAVATEAEMTLNTWHHLSISVDLTSGFVWTGFNGVVTQRTALSTSINNSALPIEIGRFTTYHYFTGYLQDLRITKGVARYTSNFTPPEKFAGKLAGTVLTDTNIGANSVIIRRWSNKEHREIITPNIATGVWESNFLGNDKYDITYLAEGCAPQIHGPYVPE